MTDTYHGHDLLGRLHHLPPFHPNPPGPTRFDIPKTPLTPNVFDAWLLDHTPRFARDRFELVFEQARHAAGLGLAAPAPPVDAWRRHLVVCWHHAADLEVILNALGSPKPLAGVHDLTETALGLRIKQQLVRDEPWWLAAGMHRVDDWYLRWVDTLADQEEVNIGYLNPHLAASFYWRGLDPTGPANASSAHLLSDHHFGTPERPMDVVEQAVNWIAHQLPREHHGVHHTPIQAWSALEHALQSDPQAKASDLLRALARDIAPVMAELEASGHLVPWHRLSP